MSAWKSLQLSPALVRGLQDRMFDAPTEIQAKVVPIALQPHRDVIGAAETVCMSHYHDADGPAMLNIVS